MFRRTLPLCVLLSSVASAATLSDFEAPATLAPWHADKGVELKLVPEHASSGKGALRVAFPAGTHGVWMEPVKPADWLSKDKLALDVYNGHNKDTVLVVRVFDARGKQLEKKEKLFAIVATRVELPLMKQHWLDLSRIQRLWIGVEGLAAPASLFLDNIRIVSARPKLTVPAAGAVIQAEDFTRGRCMINPTGWGERRNDTPIIQAGAGGGSWAEWDVEVEKAGRYQLDVKHAAADSRPCRVLVDSRVLDPGALVQTTGSWEGFTAKWFTVARIHLEAGKHTVRIDRGGAIPHIDAVRLMPTTQPLFYPALTRQIASLKSSIQSLREAVRQLPRTTSRKRLARRTDELQAKAAALGAPDASLGQIERLLGDVRRDCLRASAAAQTNVPEAKVRYAVAVETSLTKVFPELHSLSATPSGKVEIRLAANEYECAQVVVVPMGGPLKHVAVSASALVNRKAGTRIAAEHVRLHRVGFVRADSDAQASEPIRRWPDPLLPNAPFDVPADEVRPVWITAYAPKGTPPGTYEGTLTVAPKGEPPTRLPLLLQVYGFQLDDETHVKTTFFLPINWSKMSPAEVLRWMDYVMPYRIGIMDIGWGWGTQMMSRFKKNPDGTYDFSRVDADLAYVFARHMNSVSLGDTHFTMADKPEADKREMVRFLRAYASHIKAKGWWDRCYYKLPDEPGDHKERLAKVKAVADLVKEADPAYRRLCTVKVREDMFGYVDVWCPLLSWHDDAIYAKARARGDEIWMYTCCGPRPPWANIAFIDQEAIAHRILMWTCWRFNYGGYLYWGIKFWPKENFGDDGKPLWPEKPWTARITDKNWQLPAGDGYLAYPDKDGRPLPCIRIELYRDGVEDYEYHYLLKKALGSRKDAEAEKLLNLTYDDKVCPDGLHYTRDPQVLLRRRHALATAIERLVK